MDEEILNPQMYSEDAAQFQPPDHHAVRVVTAILEGSQNAVDGVVVEIVRRVVRVRRRHGDDVVEFVTGREKGRPVVVNTLPQEVAIARRGNEQDVWRVLAAENETTVTLDPPVAAETATPGLPPGAVGSLPATRSILLTASTTSRMPNRETMKLCRLV